MNKINLDPAYYQYLRRVERACRYIWMTARGSDAEATVYGDAVQYAKEILASYIIKENPLNGSGASMYADELDRLTRAGEILDVLVAQFTESFVGYKHISDPEVLLGLAAELWGVREKNE